MKMRAKEAKEKIVDFSLIVSFHDAHTALQNCKKRERKERKTVFAHHFNVARVLTSILISSWCVRSRRKLESRMLEDQKTAKSCSLLFQENIMLSFNLKYNM